jgi:hypothetical protein
MNQQQWLSQVAEKGTALQHAPAALRIDKEIVLAAVTQHGHALQYAALALRADKQVVLAAVAQDGFALTHAAEALRADKEVVLAAVTQHGSALQCAAEALHTDKEVVLAAVVQNGRALQWVAEALRADKEVVLAAVAQDGIALQCAAQALRADKEVVLVAVAQNGDALRFAAGADREVVLAAVAQTGHALRFAVPALRHHAGEPSHSACLTEAVCPLWTRHGDPITLPFGACAGAGGCQLCSRSGSYPATGRCSWRRCVCVWLCSPRLRGRCAPLQHSRLTSSSWSGRTSLVTQPYAAWSPGIITGRRASRRLPKSTRRETPCAYLVVWPALPASSEQGLGIPTSEPGLVCVYCYCCCFQAV